MLLEQEPLKMTVSAKPYGYMGTDLADILRAQGLECEFSDPDYIVFMFTPENPEEDLQRLGRALRSIPPRAAILQTPPVPNHGQAVLPIRDAMLSLAEMIDVDNCVGRILANPSVGCPPAVPILVCGERIDSAAAACFRYYGIERISVVKEEYSL